MTKIEFDLPITTVSEANCSEHWTKKSKRHKNQQFFVKMACDVFIKSCRLPCKIKMTRLARTLFDDDNVVSSLKYVRDELSEHIARLNMTKEEKEAYKETYITKEGRVRRKKGHFDNDPRMKWEYGQEKYFRPSVRICIEY